MVGEFGSVVFTVILTGGVVVISLLGVAVEVTVVVVELGAGGDVVVVTVQLRSVTTIVGTAKSKTFVV